MSRKILRHSMAPPFAHSHRSMPTSILIVCSAVRARSVSRVFSMTRDGRLVRPAPALFVVAAAYAVVQLAVVGLHTTLGWDEAIYVSQLGQHGPVAWFDAPRARGITLLAAPVVTVTSSLVVLRLWTTAVSAALFYAAFRTWLSVRRTAAVPLAAGAFAALWVTEFYGAEVMPNLYVAFGAVTAAGFVVRALSGTGRRPLLGVFGNVAWVALVRPSDAAWLCAALAVTAVAMSWRSASRWPAKLVGVLLAGFVAGSAEWVVEAVVRFGGLAERLRMASAENAGRLTFSLPQFARAVDGPLLCRPCTGYRVPWIGLVWWLLLLPLVVVGVRTAVRAGRRGEVIVPLAGAVALAAEYVFFITYAAPRFLLPAYALLSLPAATGAVALTRWLRSRATLHGLPVATVPAVIGVVALSFVTQQGLVLEHEVGLRHVGGRDQQQTVKVLRRAGVVSPCVLGGRVGFEVAYAAGCAVDYDAVKDVLDRPGDTPGETLNDGAADRTTLDAIRGSPVRYALVLVGGRLPPPVVGRGWGRTPLPDGAYTVYLPRRAP
jgi:hypothetical protein